ncbi:uncharacterized protein PODANS_5_11600 [Podospora anserina S mat+]|uniref:Podospora anserina S mat+ genomic DNA chromosome 5, supercontig 10 n=1 Tax=Podospora anserina (strain S / ATCC MYA-4624 / DSM 980 / FGSC 10383) TaxID=515849 RepID=B2APN6_PODAN|nr:uncharacterized protein PODANS_5_11600 [Podospora anserina S mat+]CAP65968.1 unnamed protein product [Podospora anserina S mat+]
MADKYVLRVTAGPSYDLSTHQLVNVNSSTPTTISSDLISASLNVRIQNHHRSVPPTAPRTSPYFEQEPHKSNNDQYSIAFKFKLHAPERDESHRNEIGEAEDDEGEEIEEDDDIGVKGGDLQFGNDFDHPIRDRLPPGFGAAMRIVKWWVDPGLEGDPYADTPYLYGVGLSSFNAVHVGPGVEDDPKKGGIWVEEGGDEKWRIERGVPREGRERMKWGLKGANLERWVWEYGREYAVDFYNPYIDFGEFALRLPGFGLGIMRYWDGQGLSNKVKRLHQLRYVLRNKKTKQVYLVVLFTLHLKGDVNEDGSLKPAAIEALKKRSGALEGEQGAPLADDVEIREDGEDSKNGKVNEDKMVEEARKKLEGAKVEADEDVD